MPVSLRNAIITLLYKKKLPQTTQKLAILAGRLRDVIDKILPKKQKCGAPNRFMEEILVSLDSICELADEENRGGALICVDQEKAFDRVNHDYLFKILEEMGINRFF